MSIFNFPRLNIKGLVAVNVGTGNNDDYSLQYDSTTSKYSGFSTIPVNGQQGQSLRLGNSATVEPYVFDDPNTGQPMTDDQMVEWMRKGSSFANYGTHKTFPPHTPPLEQFEPKTMIPGEWNFYGDMGMNMFATSVVGVTVPSSLTESGVQVYTSDDPLGLVGAQLSFNNRIGSTGRSTAMLIDINPEAPQASQVYSDFLRLEKNGEDVFHGKPSKAVTRWINFQRNTKLNGPNGAAGTFQCTIPLEDLKGQPILNAFSPYVDPDKKLEGLVFRYTLFRSLQEISTFKYPDNETWVKKIEALYETKGINPSFVQISGTIAPWYEGEMESAPTGSFLVPEETIPSPGGNCNPNNCQFQLAPAVVNWGPDDPLISLDLSAALPDAYNDDTYDPKNQQTNPKFDFGDITFQQRIGTSLFPIGPVNYQDTAAGDAAGWIFDYKVNNNTQKAPAEHATKDNEIIWPRYVVNSKDHGDLLGEQRLYFVSDQANIYAEQALSPTSPGWSNMPSLPAEEVVFTSQGYRDAKASFNAFVWGKQTTGGGYMIWLLDQTYVKPPKSGVPPSLLQASYTLGEPITLPVKESGVYIITITEAGATPESVAAMFDSIMTPPMINVRVLPNKEYDNYYTFDAQGNPVATAGMDWNAVYQEVFRNYYFLYPAMSKIIPLNQPDQWIGPTLFTLKERIATSAFDTMLKMARTRDISATRRWLLEAYINKFATSSPPANVTPTAV
ncbi:MAG: hypothetical protein AB8H12_02205 [Lewinella sp.]